MYIPEERSAENLFSNQLVEKHVDLNLSFLRQEDVESLHGFDDDFQDLRLDFQNGFRIRKNKGTYSLCSSRFTVFLRSRIETKSKNTVACFTKNPISINHPPVEPGPFIGNISIEHISESNPCNLEVIYRQYQRGMSAARNALASKGIPAELTRWGAEKKSVIQKYKPVEWLLNIFEDHGRSSSEFEIGTLSSFAGEVNGSQNNSNDKRLYKYLAVLDQESDLFHDGDSVRLVFGSRSIGKARILEIQENKILLSTIRPFGIETNASVKIYPFETFDRQNHRRALRKLFEEETVSYWPHLSALLCFPQEIPRPSQIRPLKLFDQALNKEQVSAVNGAVSAPFAYFLQGPPGTGKTRVITEIIRQLCEKGERVLLVSQSHPAVDNVLKLFKQPGDDPDVIGVRLSRDESKLDEKTKSYHELQVSRQFTTFLKKPSAEHSKQVANQVEATQERIDRLKLINSLLEERQASTRNYEICVQEAEEIHDDLEAEMSKMKQGELKLDLVGERTKQSAKEYQLARERLDVAERDSNRIDRFKSIFGRGGLSAARSEVTKWLNVWQENKEKEKKYDLEVEAVSLSVGKLRETQKDLIAQKEALAEKQKFATKAWLVTVEGTSDEEMEQAQVRNEIESLLGKLKFIGRQSALEKLWFQTTGFTEHESVATNEKAIAIGQEVTDAANLVCATTVGIGGHRKLIEGQWRFDTMIVDEASRVTDAEILIGATCSKKLILVGDVNQLPPHVQQDEEYLIQAMLGLHLVESNIVSDLEGAIGKIEEWWREDEDLKPFRERSVRLQVGILLGIDIEGEDDIPAEEFERLRCPQTGKFIHGIWDERYRNQMSRIFANWAGKAGSPYQDFIGKFIDMTVRSLFERCLKEIPEDSPLCQSLEVQRRMVAPIASLVNVPIYDSKYRSPGEEDLQKVVRPLNVQAPFDSPVVFLDTSLHPKPWQEDELGGFRNIVEAEWIVEACCRYESGLQARDGKEKIEVAILCFYKAQARLIAKMLKPHKWEFLNFAIIDSIDRIQGQEADLVFLSFCRTFKGGGAAKPGFARWLQDHRRLNVACTRARRALVLVGHGQTLEKMSRNCENLKARLFYSNFFKLIEEKPDLYKWVADLDTSASRRTK